MSEVEHPESSGAHNWNRESAADPLVFKMAIDLLRTGKGSRGAPSFFDCLVMAFATHYQMDNELQENAL